MSNAAATQFLAAKREFEHQAHQSVQQGAIQFRQRTGMLPADIELGFRLDCLDGDRPVYVRTASTMDFALGEACR